jgi:hypothetical protein
VGSPAAGNLHRYLVLLLLLLLLLHHLDPLTQLPEVLSLPHHQQQQGWRQHQVLNPFCPV